MKEITVTIQFDENRRTIDSDVVFDALCEYFKGDGIVDVKPINFRTFYPQMIAEELSKVQPMSNDVRLVVPDLLKDSKNESK